MNIFTSKKEAQRKLDEYNQDLLRLLAIEADINNLFQKYYKEMPLRIRGFVIKKELRRAIRMFEDKIK